MFGYIDVNYRKERSPEVWQNALYKRSLNDNVEFMTVW